MKKQLKQFLKLTTAFALINGAVVLKTYAQSNQLIIKPELASKGGGGGRDFEVATISQKVLIEENFLKIKKFFLNHAELALEFSEVNIDELVQKIEELEIEITSEKLYDKYGVESTALNFPDRNLIKYNSSKLNELTKKPELFFVLNFHEVLGLLGIEESNPKNKDLFESYPISSRLVKYVSKVNRYDLIISKSYSNDQCTYITDRIRWNGHVNGTGAKAEHIIEDKLKKLGYKRVFVHSRANYKLEYAVEWWNTSGYPFGDSSAKIKLTDINTNEVLVDDLVNGTILFPGRERAGLNKLRKILKIVPNCNQIIVNQRSE